MGLLKFIDRVCVQTAIYWEPTGTGLYGEKTFAVPRETKVRWDDSAEVITTNDGKQIVSKAQLLITEELKYEGYVLLGELDDFTGEDITNPLEVPGAYEIKRTDSNPLFRSTDKFVRQVWL